MTETRLHGVAVYNPDLLSRDELVAQFVARRNLLDHILGDLRRPGFGEHQLIVGHRGMGKTTLLRMLRFSIEDDAELAATWFPLTFPEEQYNVSRLSDLYVNCLDALSDALESSGRRQEADALDRAIAALSRRDDTERATAALELLRSESARLDRRLLLLVDNFELIAERLSKQEGALWSLRELLSHEPRLLLIAASPTVLGATRMAYDAPFYEFFRSHELGPLTFDETKDVLHRLSSEHDEPQVSALLDTDPARIQTLHTLAGGNPRTIVLLFGVLAQGTEGDVRSDLERLLDLCTPLYKSRFEELPAQAQQVVDALAIRWDPVSAGELAEDLRLDVNAVSSQLNRLVQHGILEKVEYDPETKTGFQVAERFFNIWYLMRASRRLRKRLTWLVQFLKLFYGAEHLIERAARQLGRTVDGTSVTRLRDAEFCFALADALEWDRPLKIALESRAIASLMSDVALRKSLATMIDVENDADLPEIVDRQQWVKAFAEAMKTARLPDDVDREEFTSLLSGAWMSREQRLETVTSLRDAPASTVYELVETLKPELLKEEALFGRPLTITIRHAIAAGHVDSLADSDGFRVAAAALSKPSLLAVASPYMGEDELRTLLAAVDDPLVWCLLADTLNARGEYAEAEEACRRALKIEPNYLGPRLVLAETLNRVGRASEGQAMLEPVMDALQEFEFAWRTLGALLAHQGLNDRAVESFRRALSINPNDSRSATALAQLLVKSGREKEAVEILREMTKRDPIDENAWIRFISVLTRTGAKDQAEIAVLNAVTHLPNSAAILHAAGRWLVMNGRPDRAIEFAERARAVNNDVRHLTTLATALTLTGRWDEGTPLISELLRLIGDLDELLWLDLRVLFGVIARRGRAEDAGRLIDEQGEEDRWRPLREALRLHGQSRRSGLRRLAPEVRMPTRDILKFWDKELPLMISGLLDGSAGPTTRKRPRRGKKASNTS